MLSYLITFAFVIIIMCNYINNKPTIAWQLAAMILVPRVGIMGRKIDGLYFILLFVFIIIIIRQRGCIHIEFNSMIEYVLLLVGVHVIYYLSGILFGGNSHGEMIKSVVGALKLILMMWELYECNRHSNDIYFDKEILNFITIVVIANLIMVVYEVVDGARAYYFLSDVYFNSSESQFIYWQLEGSKFTRYMGLFPYPMDLGIFMAFSIGYAMSKTKFIGVQWFFIVIGAFGLGVVANSKSFILGVVLIVMMYFIKSLCSCQISKVDLLLVLVVIIVCIIVIMFYDIIYGLILYYLGSSSARYFGVFKDPSIIFYGRSIALKPLIKVVKDYWLFGVGVDPLLDERVMDNAYLMIIHNGGIVSLIIIIAYYIRTFINTKVKENVVILYVLLFALGMGFQTLFNTDKIFWVLYILMVESGNIYSANIVDDR